MRILFQTFVSNFTLYRRYHEGTPNLARSRPSMVLRLASEPGSSGPSSLFAPRVAGGGGGEESGSGSGSGVGRYKCVVLLQKFRVYALNPKP